MSGDSENHMLSVTLKNNNSILQAPITKALIKIVERMDRMISPISYVLLMAFLLGALIAPRPADIGLDKCKARDASHKALWVISFTSH